MVAAREPASVDCATVHAAVGYAASGYTVADLGLLGCMDIQLPSESLLAHVAGVVEVW